MIHRVFTERARRYPNRAFLSTGARSLTYGEALDRVAAVARAKAASRDARVAIHTRSDPESIVQMLALDRLGARVHLVPPDLPDETVAAIRERLGVEVPVAGTQGPGFSREGSGVHRGEVVLFTSGTTGIPKATLHTWSSLAGRIRVHPDLDGSRWLLTYALGSFAGLQVLLHVIRNAGMLVFGADSPVESAARAAECQVDHVSGTPTFFRLVLAATPRAVLAAWRPRQITIGGEAVDQALLDALKARFPAARLTHIYASTELGACFSVHDGRAGFPASYLDNPSMPARLRVVDGELWISSPHAMRGYLGGSGRPHDGGLFPTGDLVAVHADRVCFLGRREERINVGGNKVYPRQVESVIQDVPGIQVVRVSGARSSLIGQVVQADVVPRAGVDPIRLRREILTSCRARLRPHEVPRLLNFVESLGLTASIKVTRR